jgi:methyl-accepting chemotaxis protein
MMKTLVLLLAQDTALETAEKGLSLLEKINAGGVPLICLVISVLCGFAFYWQLKSNKALNETALSKAEDREATFETNYGKRRDEMDKLYREMMDRDRDAQEATTAMATALEGVTASIKDETRQIESLDRSVKAIENRLEELERAVRRSDAGSK